MISRTRRTRTASPTAARPAATGLSVAGVAVAGLAVAGLLAGCGSKPAATSPGPPAGISGAALATTLASPDGTTWAVVDMGGSAAQHDNFWELFVRPAGASAWHLATPAGVASNGGLVATTDGPGALLAGFRPSQDLTFSPLAATADGGGHWSQNALLDAGLADVPTALAGSTSSQGGRVLALTDTGGVELGSSQGTGWTRLTTLHALAASAAGRACGLTALTAAAWTPAGAPLLGGNCRRPGRVGIVTLSGGAWRASGPALPASLATGPVSVVGLNTTGTRSTAVLAVGTGAATDLLMAWSPNGGRTWTLSQPLRVGAQRDGGPSVSFGADGSAGVALSSGLGALIGWQAPAWQRMPKLPARTATLLPGPTARAGGIPEALASSGGTLTVWQLARPAAGAKTGSSWRLGQTLKITIPYGSSG